MIVGRIKNKIGKKIHEITYKSCKLSMRNASYVIGEDTKPASNGNDLVRAKISLLFLIPNHHDAPYFCSVSVCVCVHCQLFEPFFSQNKNKAPAIFQRGLIN